jgi:ABC-2 type transport system permease protein
VNLLHAIADVMRREFARIAARPPLWGLLIAAPVVLFALIAAIYADHVVTDIPIAVCDQDHTELSRNIVRMVESTRSLKIANWATSAAEIEDGIKRGTIQGGIVIPDHLEADLKSGQAARVVVYKNTVNLIIGNLIYRDAATIIKTVSAGVLLKKLQSKGMSADQAMEAVQPVRLDVYSLFNPGYNYADFLVATLLPVMLQMMLMLAGVLAINSETAEGTLAHVSAVAGHSVCALLLGKLLPYAMLGTAAMLGLLGIVFPLLAIPVEGGMMAMILFSMLFVLATLAPVMLLSSLVADSQFATEIAVLLSTPAFLFSGETYPLRAAPQFYHVVATLLPSTHFLTGFIKLQLYDAPLRYLAPEISALALFVAVPLLGAWWKLSTVITPRPAPASEPEAAA